MKRNKAPGPDGIQMEFFKTLNSSNTALVLDIIQAWWSNEDMPTEVLHAKIALIYKKGDPKKQEN